MWSPWHATTCQMDSLDNHLDSVFVGRTDISSAVVEELGASEHEGLSA